VKTNLLPGRRFPVVLALLGVLAAVAALGVTASAAGAAAAKPTTFKAVGQSTVSITKVNNLHQLPSGITASDAFTACQFDTPLLPTGPCSLTPPPDDAAPLVATHFPSTSASQIRLSGGPALGSNFDGISDVSQRVYTGHHYTPPDQGLCVGPAGPLEHAGVPITVPGTQTVIVEMTNNGWGVFSTSGTSLFADGMPDLFSDANSSGDPQCRYDKTSRTFFFTEIGALNNMYYTTDLVVMNAGGYTAYNVDTASLAGVPGFCFPDFPHQGADTHALYITINEFCGDNEEVPGTGIFAIDKAKLVAHGNPNANAFALGANYFGFEPASEPSTTEYLVASEQNFASAKMLDVATVTGDNKIAKGGTATLSVTSIPSEVYSEPVDATSTGDDTTCVFNFGTWCSVPEATLNSVDDRVEQVQLSGGMLYTSLSTSMKIGTDPTVVDGAAWFQIDPTKMKVAHQGYVGAAKTFLLMPSIAQTKVDSMGKAGHLVMDFSMTSKTMNPSTGYVTSINQGHTFSAIRTTGHGTGPHVSFSTFEPGYDRRRWGDYSQLAIDPVTGAAWMADEYVPGGDAGADQVDNWGTRVWQVSK
jgi:hypothetical protein